MFSFLQRISVEYLVGHSQNATQRRSEEAVNDNFSFCWNFHKCSLYLLKLFNKETPLAAFNTSFATPEKLNSLFLSLEKEMVFKKKESLILSFKKSVHHYQNKGT